MTQAYPGYPPQPAPQYPSQPAQQPYAPPVQQFPPAPQYPAQFPVQQGYPAPQMAPPPVPLAQGSIDDFFAQPSAGGGKSLSFKAIGTRYIGIVTRPLGNGDIQQQTDTMGRPQFFRDGRPKFVMKVPLQMQPSAEHPDGLATWFVKGQTRDELARAMAEAGAPAGPPEAGAIIDVTYVSDRQSGAGMNPAKQFKVVYTRPDGTTPSPAPAAVPQPGPTVAPSPVAQQPAVPPVYGQVPQQPAAGAPYAATPTAQPGVSPVQQATPAPAPQQAAPAQPAAAPQPPTDLSPEQQALLARLTSSQPQG